MQPSYLPWAGYFHLMSEVDYFIFLDDVQLARPSWQTRNRVLLGGLPHWLTVPVRRTHHTFQRIEDTLVDDTHPWRERHRKLIDKAYGAHPHAADLDPLVALVGDREKTKLADLNIAIIRHAATTLGLTPQFLRASALDIQATRSARLIDICRTLGCNEYLSPTGSSAYLAEDRFTEQSDVRLLFQNFAPAPYEQSGTRKFQSHLSILDVLANIGIAGAHDYVRSGSTASAV